MLGHSFERVPCALELIIDSAFEGQKKLIKKPVMDLWLSSLTIFNSRFLFQLQFYFIVKLVV